MTINRIETPVGTFTRKSRTAYRFAAVAEAAVKPDQGLRVVGNRKGDPRLNVTETLNGRTFTEERVRYHIVWSSTSAGARKNAEGYPWAKATCVGVFPVVHVEAAGKAVQS